MNIRRRSMRFLYSHVEGTKVCANADCHSKGKPQSLLMFGPDHDQADGYSTKCVKCEIRRVMKRK